MSHPDDTVERVQRPRPRGPRDARLDGIRFERLPLPYREVYRLATDRWSRLSSGREVRRLIRDLHAIRGVLPNHLIDWERPDGHPHSLVVVALTDSRAVGFAWVVGGSEPTAHVKEVAVLPAFQNHGIGPRLVLTVGEWMGELGHDSLSILPITGTGAWVTAHGFRWHGGNLLGENHRHHLTDEPRSAERFALAAHRPANRSAGYRPIRR